MQYNCTFLSLLSLSDSLLSPVTYFGGFLKGSQRKHFHFCSHLSLSNGVRWRDSRSEVGREEGYAVSGERHMGRRRAWRLDGGDVHCRLGEARAVRGQMRCDFNNICFGMFRRCFLTTAIDNIPLQRPTLNHIVREDALHCGVQSSVLSPQHSDSLAPLTPVTSKLHHVLALTFYSPALVPWNCPPPSSVVFFESCILQDEMYLSSCLESHDQTGGDEPVKHSAHF